MNLATSFGLMLASCSLSAQELRWQLPPRGAAVYVRKLTVEQTYEPKDVWVPGVWAGEPQMAAVLASELADNRQHVDEVPCDPRELLASVAFDLRPLRGGKARVPFEGRDRFQPVRADVVMGELAADGGQSIEITIELDAKAARTLANPNLATMRGRWRGSRTIDSKKGLVTRLAGSAEFTVDYPAFVEGQENRPKRQQRIRITDLWTLDAVLVPDDAEFRRRVTKAIHSSVAKLQKDLTTRFEQPFVPGGDPFHDHQPGELALVLLAVVRGGEDARDPIVQRGYTELRKLVIQGTYELGVAILAMEALYTPLTEWAGLREGRLQAPMPRTLAAEDFAIVQGWAKELLDNIDTTTDPAYLRRWHYGPSVSWDNSTTQYALLGLYGAALCGVEISPTVWTSAMNHWLQCAQRQGSPDWLRIASHQDVQKGSRTRASGNKVQPTGWSYHEGEVTGSMTTAGIAALTLCCSALRIQKKGSAKVFAEADAAVRGGFLWLQQNFSVRHNPGPRGEWDNWQLYYLYGLERACELNQVALLGEHDWYFEGAVRLLSTQRDDGGWGGWVDTAFGLLFLKKAALPVVTGR